MFTEAGSQLHTIRDLLRFAVSRFNQAGLFFGHGSASAFDEAVYLILHTLHLPPDQLEPFLDARLTDTEKEQVLQIIRRRVTDRIPAAYLTSQAWLGDFSFYVDERVIIPRSYIAGMLQEQLTPWIPEPAQVHTALDLCTGSGCLAILIAHAFGNATVDAADISADALAVATRNIQEYDLAQQITPIRSDLFSALSGRRYDLIISNPPYVDAAAMAALPAEYHHEPRQALSGGDDGLDLIRTLLDQAARHLTDHGLLIVEIGHNQTLLEQDFPHIPFTWLETGPDEGAVFLLERNQLR